MITLGLDPHPGSPTVVALDSNGSVRGDITVPNTAAGIQELHGFAAQFSCRRWAIEGPGNRFIAAFVEQSLSLGEVVHSIAPSLTSQYRSRRGRKKNDVVDAANIGRVLLANPQLPILQVSDKQRELQELSRAQRRLSEQLKANRSALAELSERSVVRAALEEVIRTLISQLGELEKQLRKLVRAIMPCLLDLPGIVQSSPEHCWQKSETPGDSPRPITSPATVALLPWKEAAVKTLACKSIHAGTGVSTGPCTSSPLCVCVWTAAARSSSLPSEPIRVKPNALPCAS